MDTLFQLLCESINICESSNITYWVVGGFAIDGKRGFISRNHTDIDLCIHQKDIAKCLLLFGNNEFQITKQGMKYVFYKAHNKIDVFILTETGSYYERKREWFTAQYPKEIFDRFQRVTLQDLTFKVPSNEGIRHYALKSTHISDVLFATSLVTNDALFSKIQYTEFADYKESIKDVITMTLNVELRSQNI